MASHPSPASEERAAIAPISALGFVTGLVGIVLIVSLFSGSWRVASPPTATLGDFTVSSGSGGFHPYWLFPVASVVVFAILLAPFLSLLGDALAGRRPGWAKSATYLSVTGAVVVALGFFLSYAVLTAYATTLANPPVNNDPAYAASIWLLTLDALEGFGVILLGAGLLIFASLAWTSRTLPRWLAVVGFVGGVAGLLAGTPTWGTDFALIVPFALVIWCLAAAATFARPTDRPGLTPTGD